VSEAKPWSSTKVRVYAGFLFVIVGRFVWDLLRGEPFHWALAVFVAVVIVVSGLALILELRKPQAEQTAD
jgi:hypothetical protein